MALEIPGDLGWITLLVALLAIAWHVGILKESAARRAVATGAGVALLAIPVTVWLRSSYSVPRAVQFAVFYIPVVTAMLLVWFENRVRTLSAA